MNEVRRIKSCAVDSWRDEKAVNELLAAGWVILSCAPGQTEMGDSYVQMLLGHPQDAEVAA